jgi:hypothetical protein
MEEEFHVAVINFPSILSVSGIIRTDTLYINIHYGKKKKKIPFSR